MNVHGPRFADRTPEQIAAGLDSNERDDLLALCFRARPRTHNSMARMVLEGLVEFTHETASGTTWYRATALGRKVRAAIAKNLWHSRFDPHPRGATGCGASDHPVFTYPCFLPKGHKGPHDNGSGDPWESNR